MEIKIPEKLIPLFETDKRYILIYGGRGSAKSWSVADFLLVKGIEKKRRILCCREVQNSIRDSVHKLLSDKINFLKLDKFYQVLNDRIKSINGTEFIFKGLHRNEQDIKSTEGIDFAWVEEAHTVSRRSLEVLTPTIRNENSQIIFSYNPTNIDDPVHQDYTLAEREDCLKLNINYIDNPWFPEVLKMEMEYDKRTDFDKYLHKWEGECVAHSEAQVFYGKWEIENFETPEKTIFYYGADWGFSNDPTALIRSFIIDKEDGPYLYIDYEAWAIGVDIIDTPALFDQVPMVRHNNIIADSARPETISHMNNHGFRVNSAKKGKGSVEDGIAKIRGFLKVIIHPRCKKTIDEFRNYTFKVDPRTEEISTVPEDKSNHLIDALRYALENIGQYATVTRW